MALAPWQQVVSFPPAVENVDVLRLYASGDKQAIERFERRTKVLYRYRFWEALAGHWRVEWTDTAAQVLVTTDHDPGDEN